MQPVYICPMIKIDTNEALKKIKGMYSVLSEKEINQGQARAINHTIAKAKTSVSKEIRKFYNVTAKDIKDSLSITKASSGKLYGYIMISGKPLPIIAFKPRQTKKGVVFTIKKGKKVMLPGAFLVTFANGHKAVVAKGHYKGKGGSFQFRRKRQGKAPRLTKKGIVAYPDLNITELRTVSIPEAFANQTIQQTIIKEVGTSYVNRLSHELNYILSKVKP